MQTGLAETFARAARGEGLPVDVLVTATGPVLRLEDLLRLHGQDTPAIVLMLLALVSVMPVAGAGMVLSLGMFAIAWRWRHGARAVSLPGRLRSLSLGQAGTRRSLQVLAWLYARTGRWLHPRWTTLTRPGLALAWSAWIAAMGFLIFLPLPLGNVLPATSLVVFSLGWMFRDGLALVVSLLIGVLAIGFALLVGHALVDLAALATQAWSRLF
jgi:hypothetical protein